MVLLDIPMNKKKHFIHAFNMVIFGGFFLFHTEIIAQMDKDIPSFTIAKKCVTSYTLLSISKVFPCTLNLPNASPLLLVHLREPSLIKRHKATLSLLQAVFLMPLCFPKHFFKNTPIHFLKKMTTYCFNTAMPQA